MNPLMRSDHIFTLLERLPMKTRFRLYVFLSHPETKKGESDYVPFDTYDQALDAARSLEAQISEAPSSRKIVELAANGHRISFVAANFRRTKIINEYEDP